MSSDAKSFLIALSVLGLGGLGFYLYKNSDDDENTKYVDMDIHDEESLSDLGSESESSSDTSSDFDDESEISIPEETYKSKKKTNTTKKSKQSNTTTRKKRKN